jgi:hypothetical protein
MFVGLIELALLLGVLGLLALGAWAAWTALRSGGALPGGLPARQRAELAAAIAGACWAPAHDEADGATRVLLRRTYTGPDGRPVVLEERVLEVFAAEDPAWEARITEAMARARFRCAYLNAEESS